MPPAAALAAGGFYSRTFYSATLQEQTPSGSKPAQGACSLRIFSIFYFCPLRAQKALKFPPIKAILSCFAIHLISVLCVEKLIYQHAEIAELRRALGNFLFRIFSNKYS